MLVAEIMRRAETHWGGSASEGPYCKQEILSDLRGIVADSITRLGLPLDLGDRVILGDFA